VTPGSGVATDTAGKLIHIPFSGSKIQVDGNLDDWETFSTYTFRDTSNRVYSISGLSIGVVYPGLDSSGIRLPLSRNEVSVRFCWNYQDLFIAFSVKDGHRSE
jgi:hypothetical protein